MNSQRGRKRKKRRGKDGLLNRAVEEAGMELQLSSLVVFRRLTVEPSP